MIRINRPDGSFWHNVAMSLDLAVGALTDNEYTIAKIEGNVITLAEQAPVKEEIGLWGEGEL